MANEIRFLEKEAAILLGQMQIQEDYLNSKQNVDDYDLRKLQKMVEKFLQMLALIEAYQYLKSKNITVDDNIGLFLFVVNDDYSFRIRKFIKNLQEEEKEEEEEESIDFTIN